MYNSKIIGLGKFLPDNVVTNADLEKTMDTSNEWIIERTGIEARRHILKGDKEGTASMGIKAAKVALERAQLKAQEIDLILFATLSPDYYFPGSGVLVQDALEIPDCPAMDIRMQCSGFVYAVSTADQFIKTGMYKNVLVIGSEYHSGGLDMTTRGRNISVIFGDGAGAVVMTRAENNETGILSSHLHSEGKYAEELSLIGPNTGRWVPEIMEANDPDDISYYPYMNGQFVFKNAVVRFAEVINEGLQKTGWTADQIGMLIPHQANLRISQFVQRKFGLSDDQVYNNIQRYGNTTAASIPIALTEAWEEGKIVPGTKVVLAAFGSGFTWGSVMIQW
ncbi:MAG: ketoacyl-ACP synthase III [Flavobacteriaceae bacterium]|jgi:3-oxoacyl-[acyl-carrier-protein] synthase-3|nr:ketoacyl-ACP synthase III [Flavobacteriaceae bacterium]MDG1912432.1 ketoacyl-ACP synthase III [Flavobacteriaceae bacterium]